jgi:hypothetical protein
MKKTFKALLLILCIAISFPSAASAQNKIFEKYSDMEDMDVEYICITKSMLQLLKNKKNDTLNRQISINGVNLNGITDAIKVLLIINSGSKKVCKQMSEDFKTLKADPDYELLMMIRDNFDKVSTLFNSKAKDKELVMYINDGITQTFIVLTGNLSEDMVNKLISK